MSEHDSSQVEVSEHDLAMSEHDSSQAEVSEHDSSQIETSQSGLLTNLSTPLSSAWPLIDLSPQTEG